MWGRQPPGLNRRNLESGDPALPICLLPDERAVVSRGHPDGSPKLAIQVRFVRVSAGMGDIGEGSPGFGDEGRRGAQPQSPELDAKGRVEPAPYASGEIDRMYPRATRDGCHRGSGSPAAPQFVHDFVEPRWRGSWHWRRGTGGERREQVEKVRVRRGESRRPAVRAPDESQERRGDTWVVCPAPGGAARRIIDQCPDRARRQRQARKPGAVATELIRMYHTSILGHDTESAPEFRHRPHRFRDLSAQHDAEMERVVLVRAVSNPGPICVRVECQHR